ncbi:MAG: hypothetical protein MUE96_09320 [Bacteroidia bacterium]|jgi:hypothetical protein|nr:hypothetical protein [Bacteroidia bacterium]
MNRQIALGFSVLLHPIFVNVFSLLLVFTYSPYLQSLTANALSFYLFFVIGFTAVIPMIAVLLLRLVGGISTILLNEQHERNLPYLLTACAYLILYYVLARIPAPGIIQQFVLANSCVVVLVAVINHFYKISAHGVALGACVAVSMNLAQQSVFELRWLIGCMFIASGIGLSARLFLQAHQLGQVILGWVLGFVVLFILL